MADHTTSDLAKAVQDVSEKAQLLVREEIALAKAEMTDKLTKLLKGAVVGIVAGVFAVFGLIYLLHGLAWLLYRIISNDGHSIWIGYAIVAAALFLVGGLAGFLAARFIRRGTPPKPAMALEEAQLIRETLTNPRPGTPQGTPGTEVARR